MAAGALFRFACIAAAVTLVTPPLALFVSDAILASRNVLHDTYYVTADAGQLAMLAALAVIHHAVAAGCGLVAGGRSGVARAGWVLTGSAALLTLVKLGAMLAIVLLPPPRRYVDYTDSYQELPQVIIGQWTPVVMLIATVGMAVGWLLLAFSAAQKPDGT